MWVEFESCNHRHSHEENGNIASFGVHDGRQDAILKRRDEQKRWDHLIALSERQLKRLLADYVGYYHEDRTHLGLAKGTPNRRIRATASGRVRSQERLAGLQHRDDRAA